MRRKDTESAHVLENHLVVSVRRVIVAKDVQVTNDFDARSRGSIGLVLGDQDDRLRGVPLARRVRLANEDVDLAERVRGVRNPVLAAVDDVVFAVGGLGDGARDVCGVGRGDVRFGHGAGDEQSESVELPVKTRAPFNPQSRTNLSVHQRNQPFLFLGLGSELGKHFHVSSVGRSAVGSCRRDVRATQNFANDRVLHCCQTGRQGTVLVGQEEVPEAERACLFLENLNYGRNSVPAVELVELLMVDVLGRDAVVL